MDWKYLLTSFDGRINRAKFWAGIGILIALGIVASLIDMLIGTTIGMGEGGQLGIVSTIVSLATFYFGLAVYAKRWHDRNKSGWWTLAPLGIIIIGGIVIFIFQNETSLRLALVAYFAAVVWLIVELGILAGTRGSNRYGPDPLA